MIRLDYFKKIKLSFKLIINIDKSIPGNKKMKDCCYFYKQYIYVIINQNKNKNKICVIVEAKPLTFYSIFYFQ